MPELIMMVAALALGMPQSTEERPGLPQSIDLTAIRAVATQHDGRWPPLDTVARDLVWKVTGDSSFEGEDPVRVLLAWTFDPQEWGKAPLIKIENAELRGELQLSPTQTVFSYSELVSHRHLLSLIDDLARIERGRKMNPLEAKVSDINQKLITLQEIFRDQVIRPIPDSQRFGGTWRPIRVPRADDPEDDDAVAAAWNSLRDAFRADDGPGFAAASGELIDALAALPAKDRPSQKRIDAELRYNRIQPFHTAWQVLVAGAVIALMALAVRQKWFDGLTMLVLIAGFAVLTYGLSLRWQVAGRIPASNMFESLLFLSWGMVLFAILAILVFRNRMVPLTASGMAALSLFLADALPLDPFIRPIVPVLADTFWMSIHVPVIMVSYSVLALGVLVAHVQLVVMAAAPRSRRLSDTIDALHYWYIHVGSILLLAGIATGSMWAASSWGRYWGWDPKEVWSLVALLGYLIILHVRVGREAVPRWAYVVGALLTAGLFIIVVPKLASFTADPPTVLLMKLLALAGTVGAMALLVLAQGRFAMAAKSILCFWLIIMTYVGVNYVLGTGLHSYGFGTGAVARWMFTTGGIDLFLVALLGGAYALRRGKGTAPAVGLPVPFAS
jgi:ABC-type transport system involved in cytochrome c biogenesis permease subunit